MILHLRIKSMTLKIIVTVKCFKLFALSTHKRVMFKYEEPFELCFGI